MKFLFNRRTTARCRVKPEDRPILKLPEPHISKTYFHRASSQIILLTNNWWHLNHVNVLQNAFPGPHLINTMPGSANHAFIFHRALFNPSIRNGRVLPERSSHICPLLGWLFHHKLSEIIFKRFWSDKTGAVLFSIQNLYLAECHIKPKSGLFWQVFKAR